VKCSCLNLVAHSRELVSSLKNKDSMLGSYGERERTQTLDFKESFAFLSGQQLKGVGGGEFHQTSLMRHRTSSVKLSGSQSWPDLFAPLDKSGDHLWKPVKGFWKPIPEWTSLVHGQVRWSSLDFVRKTHEAS
jgi:hypothetical protein